MFESIVNNKNSFYKIKKEEIIKAEERMKIKIPLELKKFYEQVGIGFIYSKEKAINRIIAPEECADIRLREDVYEYDPDLELYEEFEEAAMIFFEINEGVYASIELNNNETNKIFFADKVIANSYGIENYYIIKYLVVNANILYNLPVEKEEKEKDEMD